MSPIQRLLKDAKLSVSEANRMLGGIEDCLTSEDISLLYAAANQASQAARELNQLIGALLHRELK